VSETPNCSIQHSVAGAWPLELTPGFIKKPLILLLPGNLLNMEVTVQAYEKLKYHHGFTRFFLNRGARMSTSDIHNLFNL
jgi:hypothetical protein